MSNLLNTVRLPGGLKELSAVQLERLCAEIRNFLINSVSKTGGHLASNLGAVELSVALHTVFDVPTDKIVWDVGHQSYVHKILTGRKDEFDTLRKFGGLSGFPKRSESECDAFDTGHSSTSVSAALGLARARDLSGGKYSVISVFGDGALTGGMIYEAMNDAGRCKTPLILVLNDNAMSISKNVGAVSRHLQNLRLNPTYFKSKKAVEGFLNKLPVIGQPTADFMRTFKRALHMSVIPGSMFSNFGFKYIGPVDGHDLESLIEIFSYTKTMSEPVLVHVCTTKGKGYAPAEKEPCMYHGVSPFDPKTGVCAAAEEDYSAVFGKALVRLAEADSRICAITCAMPQSTGLGDFAKRFPKRFFDVGIAEPHGVTMAAGLAAGGMVPVIPIYSTFLQRAYDQILHDVCLQNLHVVFPVDRAGVVGSDGETHQGLYDISYLTQMPNMTVLSPANFSQLELMLDYAVNTCRGPVAIRYPRGNTQFLGVPDSFEPGRVQTIRSGADAAIITSGRMAAAAAEAADRLAADGISVQLCLLPVIKPLDTEGIEEALSGKGLAVTIEDNTKAGGIGEAVAAVIAERGLGCRLHILAFPDKPIEHGSVAELDRKYGVDSQAVYSYIREQLSERKNTDAENET